MACATELPFRRQRLPCCAVTLMIRKFSLSAVVLYLSVLIAVAVLVGCSPPVDAVWNRVQASGTLRVGMDASFPPFESIGPDGTPRGLDVDLASEISSRLDLETQFVVNLPYDGLYDALTAGRVDIVISALVVNPARTADYAYSRSYFNAGQVLVAREAESESASIRDLEGHSLAVVLGTDGDRVGREWERRTSDLTLVQFRTPAEVLEALRDGKTDTALVDHVSALAGTGEGTGLTIVDDAVTEVPYACAVPADSATLLREVNRALLTMEQDGTMDQLIDKWLR